MKTECTRTEEGEQGEGEHEYVSNMAQLKSCAACSMVLHLLNRRSIRIVSSRILELKCKGDKTRSNDLAYKTRSIDRSGEVDLGYVDLEYTLPLWYCRSGYVDLEFAESTRERKRTE
jgi:hypothetical protein